MRPGRLLAHWVKVEQVPKSEVTEFRKLVGRIERHMVQNVPPDWGLLVSATGQAFQQEPVAGRSRHSTTSCAPLGLLSDRLRSWLQSHRDPTANTSKRDLAESVSGADHQQESVVPITYDYDPPN